MAEAMKKDDGPSQDVKQSKEKKEKGSCSLIVDLPKIADVYVKKTVLVTGATGFLGKVLVEKLLRSCPGIKEVLILLRQSKKGSVENRMEEFKKNQIFFRLREENPEALDKLQAVTGDITVDNAGLCAGEFAKVLREVNFIFHCAANVRFEEEPREILGVNLVGVENILKLSKSCCQLEALVHVSTAYAFCNNAIVTEQLYTESVRPHNIADVAKWMTNTELYIVCNYYMKGRPSIYPFSKAMAEMLLVENRQDVPIIIVRPSIVTASVNEPYPGWIDNYNGPSGFINVCGKGIVRTLLVEPSVTADWVPVDIVANTLITAAHYLVIKNRLRRTAMRLRETNGVPIVNCTCPAQNLITWKEVVDMILPFLRKYPSMEVYGRPGGIVTSSNVLYFVCRFTYHYIPALFIDAFSVLLFRKPVTLSIYRKIHGVMSHLEYYTTRAFTFRSPNMRKLVENMDPADRQVFPIDQNMLDWPKYMESYVLGVRRYFLRESDDTLPAARRRMMGYHCFWMVMKLSSAYGMYRFMKVLYDRGVMITTLFASFSVFTYMATKIQNATLDNEMNLKPPRKF